MSLSSGSLSLDLQDMWRDGCPKSPDLDSDMDAGAESEKMGEYDMKNLRHVLEVSFWEMIRPFLVPDDVFGMRTTASRWSVASLYGPHAELFSFSWKGSPSTNLSPFPTGMRLWPYEYDSLLSKICHHGLRNKTRLSATNVNMGLSLAEIQLGHAF